MSRLRRPLVGALPAAGLLRARPAGAGETSPPEAPRTVVVP
jgi:hypothetical protein